MREENILYLDFIARSLYMFRALSAPIIRSTINCSLLPLVQHTFRYVVSVVGKIRLKVSMIGRLVITLNHGVLVLHLVGFIYIYIDRERERESDARNHELK
jgi:hypothetical protein